MTEITKGLFGASKEIFENNKGCSMVIENVAKHLPADGHVTITNNTKFHNFFNGGEQARIHLVACVLENPFKKNNDRNH